MRTPVPLKVALNDDEGKCDCGRSLARMNANPSTVRLATNVLLGFVAGVSAAYLLPSAWLSLRNRERRMRRRCAELSKNEKLVLKYFDIPALGEPIRLLLVLGGFNWEDERVDFEEWPALKGQTKWGQLPVLITADGFELTQTKAICRFLATKVVVEGSILYPRDASIAFEIDEFIDAFEDVQRKFFPTMKIADPKEKERARANLFADDGDCTLLLHKIDTKCGSDGAMVAGVMTLADVWCFFFFKLFKCGFLEGIPVGSLDKHTNLARVERRIANLPVVQAYYRDQANKSPEGFYSTFAGDENHQQPRD